MPALAQDVFKPIDIARDARLLMKFPPAIAECIATLTREADAGGRWDSSQNVEIALKSPEFWAYWIHKTAQPIRRAMHGYGIEERLSPFRRTHFDLLPAGFQIDREATMSAAGDLMCTKGLEHSQNRLYEAVAGLTFGADIAFANLESTLTIGDIAPFEISSDASPLVNPPCLEYNAYQPDPMETDL